MAGTKKNRRGHGEGSIYQRSTDGKWCAVVDLGWVDGRRKRVTRLFTTRREAADALRKMQAQTDRGAAPDRATVATWLAYWLDNIAADDVRASTLAMYRRTVRNYIEPHVGHVRLDKLTPPHVREMQKRLTDKGLSAGTVRHARNVLSSAMGAAMADKRIDWNPVLAAKGPKGSGRPHAILSVDQVNAALRSAKDDRRLRARLICALMLGLRQGEALGLRWEDIDLQAGVLHVRRAARRAPGLGMVETELKTEQSQRHIQLIPLAQAALSAWRAESGGSGYVFHGHKGPRTIDGTERDHKAWERALQAADLPDVPLHGARGSAATMLQVHGVPDRIIADILGHAKVKTSQEHYLRSDPDQQRAALDRVGATLELD